MECKIDKLLSKSIVASFPKITLLFGLLGFLLLSANVVIAAEEKKCRVYDVELIGSYTGSCNSDGLADGSGAAKGSASYVGEFKNGKKHGYGVKVWSSGSSYVGQFVDDMRDGYGIYEWQEAAWRGERYIGQYKLDKRNGKGMYEWLSGERYRGEWQNDIMTSEPTPMMLLRGKHYAAANKAILVGGKVCRENIVGIGNKEFVSGIVEEKNQLEIKVKIINPGSALADAQGKFIVAGELVTDNILLWQPCY